MNNSYNGLPLSLNKPIFTKNPLKLIEENYYSGTLSMQNLCLINELYENMKDALQSTVISDNNNNNNYSSNYYSNNNSKSNNCGNIYSINIEKNNLFKSIVMSDGSTRIIPAEKGIKIFNVYKDKNNNNLVENAVNINEFSNNNKILVENNNNNSLFRFNREDINNYDVFNQNGHENDIGNMDVDDEVYEDEIVDEDNANDEVSIINEDNNNNYNNFNDNNNNININYHHENNNMLNFTVNNKNQLIDIEENSSSNNMEFGNNYNNRF